MAISLPIRNMAGDEVGTIDLDERVFGVRRNDTLIHQVAVAQQANKRVGTAETKTRGELNWGGAKPYRQKGTGRARQGTRTAPHYRGGGVVWGPHQRDYRQAIPRKMRRGALRSVLSAKIRDDQFIVIDELKLDEPKTKEMVRLMDALGVTNGLIVLTDNCTNVRQASNNLPKIETTRADSLHVLEVLNKDVLVLPVEAVRLIEENLLDDHRRMRRLAETAGVPAAMQPAAPVSQNGQASSATATSLGLTDTAGDATTETEA